MANLYVAMYRPRRGNYEHWALHLENGAENTIYEVINAYPNFKKNIVKSRPEKTDRHKRSILVATLNPGDVLSLEEAIAEMQPDNSTVHWNCQDYVLEILDKLEEEYVVDGDDEDYIEAKRRIKRHFGAQI